MITTNKYYSLSRALIIAQKCNSNGDKTHGQKLFYFSRTELTESEIAEFDGLIEKITTRLNTVKQPEIATTPDTETK